MLGHYRRAIRRAPGLWSESRSRTLAAVALILNAGLIAIFLKVFGQFLY